MSTSTDQFAAHPRESVRRISFADEHPPQLTHLVTTGAKLSTGTEPIDDEDERGSVVPGLDEEADMDDLTSAILVPPDGGYGWVIVAASFFCNMVVDGMIFTAGQGFQPEWERYYDVNSGTSAWAVSLLSGFYLLAGPVVSALANLFGCRKVVLAGTLLAAGGFLFSMLAPSMPILYLTFGILGGIGFGLIYMPSIVIVSYYFHKRRALATGIAVCGSGIGTFLFAPLINYLLQEFQWQSALLIMTGITLNCLVFGMLYRMPSPPKQQLDHLEELYEQELDLVKSNCTINEENGTGHQKISITDDVSQRPRRRAKSQAAYALACSGGNLDSPVGTAGMPTAGVPRQGTNRRSSRIFTDQTGRIRHYSLFSIPDSAQNESGLLRGGVSRESVARLNRPLARSDIFFQGSLARLPEFKQAPEPSQYIASTLNIDQIMSMENIDDVGGMTGLKDSVLASLGNLLNPELAKSPSFLILSLGGFLTLTGFFTPFIYLPRHAIQLGYSPQQATILIQLLGITNIVGRVFCGWLSDQPRMNALMINNVALVAGGLATVLVPFIQAYWLLCGYCIVFGFGTACFAALRSVICVDLLGLEKLNNAFGLMLMFLGLASLVGSPIAGALYDVTGDYNLSFYLTGTLVALSGVIGFPLNWINRWEKRRDAAHQNQHQHSNGHSKPDENVELGGLSPVLEDAKS